MIPAQQQSFLPRYRWGFSLIELLACLAIISVLAALMAPVIQKWRAAALSANCVSNLRQIGKAFYLYAADNNNLYPAPRGRSDYIPTDSLNANDPRKNPTNNNWMVELYPYLGSNRRGYSNSDKDLQSIKASYCPEYYRRYGKSPAFRFYVTAGYGMVLPLPSSYNNNFRFNSLLIQKPSSTLLAGDSTDYWLELEPPRQSYGRWFVSSNHLGGYEAGDPERHEGVANYLFADGHVLPLHPDDAKQALTAPFANP